MIAKIITREQCNTDKPSIKIGENINIYASRTTRDSIDTSVIHSRNWALDNKNFIVKNYNGGVQIDESCDKDIYVLSDDEYTKITMNFLNMTFDDEMGYINIGDFKLYKLDNMLYIGSEKKNGLDRFSIEFVVDSIETIKNTMRFYIEYSDSETNFYENIKLDLLEDSLNLTKFIIKREPNEIALVCDTVCEYTTDNSINKHSIELRRKIVIDKNTIIKMLNKIGNKGEFKTEFGNFTMQDSEVYFTINKA